MFALVLNDPFAALADAMRATDTAAADALLRRHPELRARLNEPIPDGAFGATALITAVHSQNREMINLLLQHGADIDARSDWWAGSFGVLDTCALDFASFLIERGATVDAHAAARLGMMDTLNALISANPELVHARGGDGQTPLHFASTVEIAKYLLDHGADIDTRDIDHESTPAQYMVRHRQDVARFLVTRGCHTDILMASALGAYELVRRYLDDDPASIRTRVSKSYFPMRNERAGGSIYIWTLGSEKTPHVIAREFGHEDVFRLLMERSSDEMKLAQACDLGDETLFNALLAKRPDLA
jgi:ankyrin repeat protein